MQGQIRPEVSLWVGPAFDHVLQESASGWCPILGVSWLIHPVGSVAWLLGLCRFCGCQADTKLSAQANPFVPRLLSQKQTDRDWRPSFTGGIKHSELPKSEEWECPKTPGGVEGVLCSRMSLHNQSACRLVRFCATR